MLLISRQGKTRLTKWYQTYSAKVRQAFLLTLSIDSFSHAATVQLRSCTSTREGILWLLNLERSELLFHAASSYNVEHDQDNYGAEDEGSSGDDEDELYDINDGNDDDDHVSIPYLCCLAQS